MEHRVLRPISEIFIDFNISCDDNENSFVIYNKCDEKNKCYGATVGHNYGMFDISVKKTKHSYQFTYREPSISYDYEADDEDPNACEEFTVSMSQLLPEDRVFIQWMYEMLKEGNTKKQELFYVRIHSFNLPY